MDDDLAEAAGIFAGDGTIYTTNSGSLVLEVRGDSDEESYYREYVKPVFDRIIPNGTRLTKRYYKWGKGHVIGIRACGKGLRMIFCERLGFPVGSKSSTVEVPTSVMEKSEYWKSYIRGVFDTDGSFYMRRCGTGMKYRQPIIDISSCSLEHLSQLRRMLSGIGFSFWFEKSTPKIRISGWKNVSSFFKLIVPHNNTKIEKFRKAEMAEWLRRNTLMET